MTEKKRFLLRLEPELAFVLVDGSVEGPEAVVGYVIGTRDTAAFEETLERNVTFLGEVLGAQDEAAAAIEELEAGIEEAKAVCRRCDVMDTCLKWALENGQDAGVWGGLSEDERRALKRRTARARRAS